MKFSQKKIILFLASICLFVAIMVGCKNNSQIDKNVIETNNIGDKEQIVQVEDNNNEIATKPVPSTKGDKPKPVEKDEIINDTGNTPPIIAAPTEDYDNVDSPEISAAPEVSDEPVEPDIDVSDKPIIPDDTENNKEDVSNLINLGEFKLTAYCSCSICCGEWAYNRPVDENGNEIVYGSTGNVLIAGVSIAVDPNVIPYGSKVVIDGHTYIAHDTGGAIVGNRIDVYHSNHTEALNFAMGYYEVFLVVE